MKKSLVLFILLVNVGILWAKDIAFTASAPEVVVVGEQFRVAYTIKTQKVKDFRAPSFDGFDRLMGPSRSQQSMQQYINGKMTSSKSITYTFVLMAQKEGEFTLPGATIVAEGDKKTSNELKIKVLPADQEPQDNGGTLAENSASVSDKDLFVTSNVSKTTVYEQEAFMLTYKIYTREAQLGFNNVKLPDFKGFHSQEIERPNNVRWSQEHYKGRNYYTAVFRQFVLFPQKAGDIKIEPARFDATVSKVVASIDPFDAFFNGGTNTVQVNKTLIASTPTIHVKQLPGNKPTGYSGGVGEFTISSSITSQEVKNNEAITLKLIISGVGNLKLLSNPEIRFPESFEVYDPKVDHQVRLTSNGLSGSKVIEYLVIPRSPGEYKIPAATFSYFDIKSKSYKTMSTQEYIVKVARGEGGTESSQMVANFTNKEDVKLLGEDIRYISLRQSKLKERGQYLWGTWTYWNYYIISFLVFAICMIIYRKKVAENANVNQMRTKKANKVAIKRLRLAGKLLKENKKEAFYDEVMRALWGYISDKLSIAVSALSKDNIEEKLRTYEVEEELIKEFISTLNECEFARYAPGDENQAMDKVYTSSLDVISKMENKISIKKR